jgi:hypothetical protein
MAGDVTGSKMCSRTSRSYSVRNQAARLAYASTPDGDETSTFSTGSCARTRWARW